MQLRDLCWLGVLGAIAVGCGRHDEPPPGDTPIGVVRAALGPSFTKMTPTSAAAGTPIVIDGLGFTGTTAVLFGDHSAGNLVNGIAGVFTVVNDTQITVTVPAGSLTGPVHVVTPGGEIWTSAFTALSSGTPTITSISPPTTAAPSDVDLTGIHFTGTKAVSIGGTPVSYFQTTSDVALRIGVAAGTASGTITVQNSSGSGVSSSTLTVIPAPKITSFLPASGQAGDTIVLTGTGFTNATDVRFSVTDPNPNSGIPAIFSVTNATTISATVPSGAVTGTIRVLAPGGGGDSAAPFTAQSSAAPTITGLSPTTQAAGQPVHVTGTGFTGVKSVSFNGTPANAFYVTGATDLDAYVPQGATTGPVTVVNTLGQATSLASLTVLPPPTISAMSPQSGPPGTLVTLTGTGFTGTSQVTLANVTAVFAVVNDTQLSVTIPTGSGSGQFNVVAPGGGIFSQQNFTVLSTAMPTVSSFSPVQGGPGQHVTVNGSGFTGTTDVSFGGAGNWGFTVSSDTQLDVAVPPGAKTGPISVTNNQGTGISAASFFVIPPPTVTGFSPTSGTAGDPVSITGAGFTNVLLVQFGGQDAQFIVVDDTHITTAVPPGGRSGPIQVGGATTSGNFTVMSAAAPLITGFSPTSGGNGTFVNITGQNFTGTTDVSFNGTSSTNIFLMGDTNVGAYVPPGATTGTITVTNTKGQSTSVAAFVVIPPPTITGFSPQSGAPGTPVTITGSGFTGTTDVSFGPAAAAFTVMNDTTLTTTVPVGAGSGWIWVNTTHGSANTVQNFTALSTNPPTITSFSPTSGGPGKQVVVTGTNFTGATQVTFNGMQSYGFNLTDDSHIQVSVPSGATTGPIAVTNTLGTAVSGSKFTVFAPPTVTGFLPASGKTGDSVVISGSGFGNVSLVQFANQNATFTIDSATQITAQVPNGATSGPLDVGGAKTSQSFTVLSVAAPTISGISPTSGTAGTGVMISGQNFSGTTGVSFNGVPAVSYFVQDDGQINANVPSGATTGKVSVTNTQGTGLSSGSFTVLAPPTITSISPTSGSPGDTVVITGTGLTGVTSVDFRGQKAAAFTIDSATQITATVPVGAATGPIGFNSGNVTSTLVFTFVSKTAPTISSFSPSSGGIGTRVTVTGTGFGGATEVDFGSISAAFDMKNDSTLDVLVPLGAATGKITVKNAAGSATSTGIFTMLAAPTITSFSPASGNVGTTIQVIGTGFTGTSEIRFGSAGGIRISTFTVANDTHLSFAVPPGATTGTFSISTPTGVVTSRTNFTVIGTAAPTITSFMPQTGGVGTGVKFSGSGFSGTTQVTFGGVPATLIAADDDKTLTALVPSGAVTGPIVITNAAGSAQTATDFVVDHAADLTITSISPGAGAPGTVVTITGTNLDGVVVGFSPGGAQAVITSDTATTLVVTVPPSATTGFLFIQKQTGTGPQIVGAPFTVYTPACTTLLAGAPCGLCEVCNASGACTVAAGDDDGCGVIACAGMTGPCGTFADLTAARCKAAGACRAPNSSDCVATSKAASGTDCGTCASCDGLGACVEDLTQNTDCPTCCACTGLGSCAPQAAGKDVKGECLPLPCQTGSCDGTGACGVSANGTACDDANDCTQTDACNSGVCVGSNFVTCTAADACHDVGTCVPTSGTCSNPLLANGTPCDDGFACTTGDACQSGVCSAPASGDACPCKTDSDCLPRDQCHVAGTCSPTTRTCSNPAAADATPCDDGDACTRSDTCVGGVCTGASPVICSSQDQCHQIGQCNPGTGQCTNPAKTDGTICDDGVACHSGDTCQAGACVLGSNQCPCTSDAQCVVPDQCHLAGTCDLATHLCSNPSAVDGTSCNDANACTTGETCRSGVCGSPTGAIVCAPPIDCREPGVCDPATGSCSYSTSTDGAACAGGACQGGACVPAPDGGAPDAATDGAVASGGAATADAASTDSRSTDATNGGAANGGATSGAGGTSASADAATASGGAINGSGGGALADSGVDASAPPASAAKDKSGCGCRTETSGRDPALPVVLGLALSIVLAGRRRARGAARATRRLEARLGS